MRELPHLIGERRITIDPKGNWTPLRAYEGWFPEEPRKPIERGWWLALGAALLVFAAMRAGL